MIVTYFLPIVVILEVLCPLWPLHKLPEQQVMEQLFNSGMSLNWLHTKFEPQREEWLQFFNVEEKDIPNISIVDVTVKHESRELSQLITEGLLHDEADPIYSWHK